MITDALRSALERVAPVRHASEDEAFLTHGETMGLAHRGDRAGYPPGNSAEAFQSAIDLGFDHLESDVHVTSDGELVLFHDDDLGAETTGAGPIGQHRWADLDRVRYVVDGEPTERKLIRLSDALHLWPHARWNLDAKDGAAVEPLIDLVTRSGSSQRVLLTAFDLGTLRRIRRAAPPETCTGLAKVEIAALRAASLVGAPVRHVGDAAQVPLDHRGLTIVDRRFVTTCRSAGIAVHVWTINDADTMHDLFDLGVDAVITDEVGKLRAVLDQRRREERER